MVGKRPSSRGGRFVVPSIGVAGAVSVLVHAGALAAACLIGWGTVPAPGGTRAAGAGEGVSDGAIVRADDPPAQSPPVAEPDAGDAMPFPQPLAAPVEVPALDWQTDALSTVIEPGIEAAAPPPPVGFSQALSKSAAPRFAHAAASPNARRGKPDSPPAGNPKKLRNGVSSGGTGAGATGPGLPGELIAKGLPASDYPLESRRRGEQGVIKVAIEILPDGSVGTVRVVSGPDYPLLRAAALSAAGKLRLYRFTPATRDGGAVARDIIIPYAYSLR